MLLLSSYTVAEAHQRALHQVIAGAGGDEEGCEVEGKFAEDAEGTVDHAKAEKQLLPNVEAVGKSSDPAESGEFQESSDQGCGLDECGAHGSAADQGIEHGDAGMERRDIGTHRGDCDHGTSGKYFADDRKYTSIRKREAQHAAYDQAAKLYIGNPVPTEQVEAAGNVHDDNNGTAERK